MTGTDPIRVGDHEREKATELLGEAMATGYLTVAEFDDRAGQAARATVRGELLALVADLPMGHRLFPVAATVPSDSVERIELNWNSADRGGAWTVPSRVVVSGSGGTARLDFSLAEFSTGRVDLELQVSISTIKLKIPVDAQVDLAGLSTSGWSSVKDKSGPPGSTIGPQIVIRGGLASMSSLRIRR